MRIVIQRVTSASVAVAKQTIGRIDQGLLIFLGVAHGDTKADADFLVKKAVELRLFDDSNGKMNLSSADVQAGFLVISQFTLLGNCAKGRRPSFDDAAEPAIAKELYLYFIETLKKHNSKVEAGQFGAMMEVSLVNDGPVTFILESKP